MIRNVVGIMAKFKSKDFCLPSGVKQGMHFSEWVNQEKLPKNSGLTTGEVDYHIGRCMTRELIEHKTIQYIEYKLIIEGYDTLTLRAFAQRDTIQGFGAPLDVDKESDVFEIQSFKSLALKFHREGYTDFHGVCHERDYTSENRYVSRLHTARRAAKREREALETPFPRMSIPCPVDHNHHTIIMAKLGSAELAKAELGSEQAAGVLDLILSEVADVYTAGYIHTDMPGYNVAISERSTAVFDQSQTVPTNHGNARELLARNVKNIVGYLRHKYPGEMSDEVDIDTLSNAIAGNEFENVNEFAI